MLNQKRKRKFFRQGPGAEMDETIRKTFETAIKHAEAKDDFKGVAELGEQYLEYLRYVEPEKKGISPDVLVGLAGNLVIAMLVLKAERFDVITTKVWSFLKGSRV